MYSAHDKSNDFTCAQCHFQLFMSETNLLLFASRPPWPISPVLAAAKFLSKNFNKKPAYCTIIYNKKTLVQFFSHNCDVLVSQRLHLTNSGNTIEVLVFKIHRTTFSISSFYNLLQMMQKKMLHCYVNLCCIFASEL